MVGVGGQGDGPVGKLGGRAACARGIEGALQAPEKSRI